MLMKAEIKPFKTIDEQIRILESHNVIIDSEYEAKKFLMKESYYSVINGYKDPFIDRRATGSLGHTRYKNGTRFDDFKSLFIFDQSLRRRTLEILMQAETAMRNATVYAFCFYNREHDAYLYPESYCPSSEYRPRKGYTRNLIRLLGTLQKAHDNRQNKAYVQHYIDAYGCVPLWVVAKTLTFGNMSSFYDLQTVKVQNAVCNNLRKTARKEKGELGIKDVRNAYRILSRYRNLCAHEERLYCARVGNGNYSFADMVKYLALVVDQETLFGYVRDVMGLISQIVVSDSVRGVVFEGLAMDNKELSSYLDKSH